MKTILQILVAGMFLAAVGTGLGQPCSITITREPQAQANCLGTTVTSWVTANGTAPLSYQWQRSGDQISWVNVPEATKSNYVILNFQAADVAYYRVVITNAECSVVSQMALLSPLSPAGFTSNGQPTNWLSVSLGASVTNRLIPSGSPPQSYQWRFNGVPLPDQTKTTIILTNLQVTNAGEYDVVVANPCGSITSRVVTLVVDPTYTQIHTGPVVTNTEIGYNANWIDYDQDGYLDLVIQRGAGSVVPMLVYHNGGDGTFTRVTTGALATTGVRAYSGSWADYDNDGRVDVCVPNTAGMSDTVFHNEGSGAFRVVLLNEGLDDGIVAWLDYNRDGFLDFLLGASANDAFYRNNGDATFSRLTAAEIGPIISDGVGTEFSLPVDVDNDGWPELSRNLYYSDGGWTNQVWRLDANGRFVALDLPALMKSPLAGHSSILWADYDNDGFLDAGIGGETSGFRLYRNLQGQGFTNVTGLPPLRIVYCQWADYDNDGWQDIFGWTSTNYVLLRNNGDGSFAQTDIGGPLQSNFGIYWGDYDNDGFLDIFVLYAPGNRRALFHHNGNTNHWLKVLLDGRASNRSGIGAKVSALATIQGRDFWQMREITAEDLCFGNGLMAHFGLGDATNVTTLRIEWPSGIVQTLTNVATNQFLTIVESQDYAGAAPQFGGVTNNSGGLQLSFTEPAANARYTLEASTNLVNWTKLMARTSAGIATNYTDTRATNYTRRFYRLQVP